MNNFELELKEYLNKHTNVIEKSLKQSYLFYDTIKVNEVEIDDDFFSAKVQILKNSTSNCISPYIPIPKKFLRKIKLEKLNENI